MADTAAFADYKTLGNAHFAAQAWDEAIGKTVSKAKARKLLAMVGLKQEGKAIDRDGKDRLARQNIKVAR